MLSYTMLMNLHLITARRERSMISAPFHQHLGVKATIVENVSLEVDLDLD